jgi:hypothetical protein
MGRQGASRYDAVGTTRKHADGLERVVRRLSDPKGPGEGQACRCGRATSIPLATGEREAPVEKGG